MRHEEPDTSTADAMRWAHRVTGLGMELVIPTLIGWYVGERYHWRPWGILGGVVVGLWLACMSLIALVRDLQRESLKKTPGDSGQERRDR